MAVPHFYSLDRHGVSINTELACRFLNGLPSLLTATMDELDACFVVIDSAEQMLLRETKSGDYCWLVWEALRNTAMNLITPTRTVIKAAAIVIFGGGVGWSMAEFDTQQLALEKAPTVSGNQVPPLSSCEAVFRQSDLAKRLGEEFGLAFIAPPVLCGDELLFVVPPPAPP